MGAARSTRSIQRASADTGFTKAECAPVLQGEVVVTTRDCARPVLATLGLGPCVGLVIAGPTMTALAHVDGVPMSHALRRVVERMRAVDGDSLVARVYASTAGLEGHLVRLRAILHALGVPLLGVSVHNSASAIGGPALNMAVDARTGAVSRDVRASEIGRRDEPYSTSLSAEAIARVRRSALPTMAVAAVSDEGAVTWAGDAFDKALLERVDPATLDAALVADVDAERAAITAPGYGRRTIAAESNPMTAAALAMIERAQQHHGPVTVLGDDD